MSDISHPASSSLFDRAQRVIPGGVNSPVRAFGAVGGTPLFFEEALGAYLTDADGSRYIDYVGSWGPFILGHGDPRVTEAIIRQAARATSFGAPSRLEVEMAELLTGLLPGMEMVRLVSSGTEATMSAIRLARGEDIYPADLSAPPYTITNYPPLYVLAQVPFVQRVGPAFWYGRLISAVSAIAAAICMLPPTILMGASLPAIVRWAKGDSRNASWWGLLYGANTMGAVVGSLIAGFYLMRVYDIYVATCVAAGINLAVALLKPEWFS